MHIILDAFEKAGISAADSKRTGDITKLTLFELGLSGRSDSKALRECLQKSLGLPSVMSAASLIEVLNTMMSAAELERLITEGKEDYNDI